MHDPPLSTARARWLLAAALLLLAGGVSGAMWRDPTVFPLWSSRWWSSTGTVLGAWLLVATAGWAASRNRAVVLGAAVLAPAGCLVAVGVSGRAVFTSSSGRFWGGIALLGALWALAFARTVWGFSGRARLRVLAGLLAGAPWGLAWVHARVPPPAGTRPALRELPRATPVPDARVDRERGVVRLACGAAQLELHPLLTFTSTSRDGFWAGASSPDPLEGLPALDGPARRASLTVTQDGDAVVVEAATDVPHEVRSHLNFFTDLFLRGLSAPGLRVGSAPPLAFLPFDYPAGRPVQFAFRSADGALRVVQATDAEKGPFTELARSPLGPAQALELTLTEGARPVCALSFLDFAAQADVTLSPATGEGIATNVVQFGVPAFRPGTPPVLHLSLAETGVGAGLDTVRHAAGVYRNRIRLTPLPR